MLCFKYVLVISGHYTNYHRLDGLSNIYFSQYGGWEVPSDSVSGEGPLPGLQMAIFLLLSSSDGKQRKDQVLSSLFLKEC